MNMLEEIQQEITNAMEYFHCIEEDDEINAHQDRLEMLLFKESLFLESYDI